MKDKKGWIAGGVALVLLLIIIAVALGKSQNVEVAQATQGTFILSVEETGYVESVDNREIQATQMARVQELLVESGDTVKAGQTLIRLASPELTAEMASIRSQISVTESQFQAAQLQVRALEAELKIAQDNLARAKVLFDSGALALVEFEKDQLQVTQLVERVAQEQAVVGGLTGQLAGLNEILSSGEIRAAELQVVSHTDGTILDIPVEAGQVVSAGVTLVQIGSTGTLEIKTELLSDEIRRVKIGQDAWITAPVLDDQAISGQVTKIYPQAFEKTSALGVVQRRVPVIISIDEIGNLQPGYEVRVAIETVHKEGVILLPRESVRLNDDGEYQVLAIIDGKVEFRVVELGEKSQQWVEILEGIEVDQFVCRDASRELKEGTRVKGVLNGERI